MGYTDVLARAVGSIRSAQKIILKPLKKVSYTNMKHNQLLKFSFVRTVALKIRKSDDFRELHENEPETGCAWSGNEL